MTERPTISPTLGELITAVDRRTPGESAIERLGAAVAYSDDLGDLADNLVGHFVGQARGEGVSWALFGEVLGVSKQGAQQRFVGGGWVKGGDFEKKEMLE